MNNFEKHKKTLHGALEAIANRGYWSPYFELPSSKVYGEGIKERATKFFEDQLNNKFEIEGLKSNTYLGDETSPYGFKLGITYPAVNLNEMIETSKEAMKSWNKLSLDERAGVCLEILDRLNKYSFEIANSVMHTTGQPYVMAFQAGGPHAQDRGLEALAYMYKELSQIPASAVFEKPMGKNPPLIQNKTFITAPLGLSLIVTCSTFPTWNSYSGLFASLLAGNAIVYKPHKGVILPIALTVKIAREVMSENGVNPDIVTMFVNNDRNETQTLAKHKDVRVIDFTGSSFFGNWLEENAKQARVYTEKAGVNCILVDDFENLKGLGRNISMSLSLYSSQMCTAPQNIFIPQDGIKCGDKQVSFDEVVSAITGSVEKLLGVDERAVEILGAIQNSDICNRVDSASELGEVVLASKTIKHPMFENATVKTPAIVVVDAEDKDKYHNEHFGPVALIVKTKSKQDTLDKWSDAVEAHGAITGALYSDNEAFIDEATRVAVALKVNLAINLTGFALVNHSAGFSDYHATGANKAANCVLADDHFVSGRYAIVTIKRDV